ncbi:MAG TPA: septum formation initiator family protein [Acidimicrobiia bacterium]|nr:septum formation initiator family protein [Acidimicrobiia bacterium]
MVDFLRSRAALVRVVAASLALVGFLFVFVFPTRTWLSQRSVKGAATERLSVLERETAKLEREADRLRSRDEIERVARDQFGLVMPGERAWAVVPEPSTTTTTTTTLPLPADPG